ncbi:hypothetical protein FACS189449_04060 [Alphaproteobacteria bacterium]|nr:hypothetical protein FACS189449_04060 [Alphaproteobacteria bacterium]
MDTNAMHFDWLDKKNILKQKSAGATMVEYVLIASLMVVATVAGWRIAGEKLKSTLGIVSNTIAENPGKEQ